MRDGCFAVPLILRESRGERALYLLVKKILRRDQIWFTEKDSKEQTDLYSLIDIVLPDGTKPRNDANYEKNYIAGRYGAIPYILND